MSTAENTPELDMTPRYVPESLTTFQNGGPGSFAVVKVESFPADQHEGSPIVNSMTAVRATLENGADRWFGCQHAYIDSHLRMVIVGTNPGDEVRMGWDIAAD